MIFTKGHVARAMQTSFMLGLVILATTLSRVASAEPERYRVELHAPAHLPTCNDPIGLREELTLALAQPLLEPPASRVLDVRIERPIGGDYAVIVALMDLEGHAIESFTHAYPGSMECFKVLHKVALLAAIEMEKKLESRSESRPTPSAPQPQACPSAPKCPTCESPPPPPPTNPPAPEPRKLRNVYVGAGPQIALGIAPEIVAGGQLVGGWQWTPSWSAELNFGATFPRDTRPWGPTVVHVYTAFSIGAAPCYRIGTFGVCGLVEWSRLWFQRRGFTSYDDHTSDAFRLGLRGFMEQRVAERLSLRVDLDVAAPVQRSNIRDDRQQERWEMQHVTGNFNAALVAWF
jgi:hypothetical protein